MTNRLIKTFLKMDKEAKDLLNILDTEDISMKADEQTYYFEDALRDLASEIETIRRDNHD